LIILALAQVIVLGGCGGKAPAGPATAQEPPKNRLEGIRRIGESNKQHDQAKAREKSVRPRR